MGLSYLIAGFVFFFLPNFTIIDLLPDFIGCILIIKGLSKLADLTPGLMTAKNAFIKVLYFSIAKFLLMFTVPYFGSTDGGYILIFTFCFVVFDFIYTLPAFKALLNGFVYLGDRTNSKVLFKNQSEFSTLTVIFIIVRASLALLTDLSYISAPEFSNVVSSGNEFYLANYRTLLVLFNFVVTTIIGVVWLNYAIKYFNGIKNDAELISFLENQYETTVKPNKGLFIRRGFSNASFMFVIGGLLMFDFLIDYVNVIPDFLGGVFFIIAISFIKKYCQSKKLNISLFIYTFAALIFWIILCIFAVKYPDVYLLRDENAAQLFRVANVFNILKYLTLAVSFCYLFTTLKEIIDIHTGSPVEELKTLSIIKKAEQIEMHKKNTLCLIVGIIGCITGILRLLLLYQVGWFQLLDYAVVAFWFINFYKLLGNIKSSVEYRYL